MVETRCLKNVVINTIINLKHTTIYKQHAINNAIPDFERNFCIKNTLCTVKQKNLHYYCDIIFLIHC